ncbi:MAG: hypothetical protein HZC54_20475 [Verrucomicrobia bacterium]|nr:hypothetical protein [Verrucomicrobiota bacterium]
MEQNIRPQLPDPAVCRAQRILPDLVECLVLRPKPNECPHATFFGDGIFCAHPERDNLAARTEAEKRRRG